MNKSPANVQDLPPAFLHRMAELLGEEYSAFLSSLQHPAFPGLRVNTLKISPPEFLSRSPWHLTPLAWCPAGFVISSDLDNLPAPQPGKHPYYTAGLYYLQEPSAMAAAEALSPIPEEKVLDLAAAPGGKATHLAALMKNTGLLVANEIHPKRVWDLAQNLERCGVTNAVVTNETPQHLADHFSHYFDRVMLDAPCSGEGMFRKGEVARKEWKPELVRSCALRQAAILEQAARLVKPGGRLAYTTCTFSPDENEGVIAKFLVNHPEFSIDVIQPASGFSPARPDWVSLPFGDRLECAVRIWPHLALGEGHFIAILVKQISLDHAGKRPSVKVNSSSNKEIKPGLDRKTRLILEEFCRANLTLTFDPSRCAIVGSYVYQLPAVLPRLAGLKLIHPGWWLGTIQKGRFIPSHALAMAISSNLAVHNLNLALGDPHISSFLAGECISSSGENAWVLVTLDGFPLGWGKRVGQVLKNYYPHGLRRNSQSINTEN